MVVPLPLGKNPFAVKINNNNNNNNKKNRFSWPLTEANDKETDSFIY
jgi:hypothetical protein